MARSQSSLPARLTKVDALAPDHWHLTESDDCYFLGEYTAREGYQFSPTNQLIINLKKGPDRRGRPDWKYKERAIRQVARALRAAIKESLDNITFVPIPPSKAKADPLYDDRMTQVLTTIRPTPPLDVRELVVQPVSTRAAHESQHRPSPTEILSRYELDITLAKPVAECIFVVDDVLTTGAHFCAVKSLLSSHFPETPVVGIFVARRVVRAQDGDFAVLSPES